MNKAERQKMMGDSEFNLEEGWYYQIVQTFADFLIDAYNEDENGRKYEHLMEVLKDKLPAEIFEEVFVGFEPKHERVKRTPVYGYEQIGEHYGDGFYARDGKTITKVGLAPVVRMETKEEYDARIGQVKK